MQEITINTFMEHIDESDFEFVITLLEDALEGLIEEIITR